MECFQASQHLNKAVWENPPINGNKNHILKINQFNSTILLKNK